MAYLARTLNALFVAAFVVATHAVGACSSSGTCPGAIDQLTLDGTATGYVTCPGGAIDKVGASACDTRVADPCGSHDVAMHDCVLDSDCIPGEACLFIPGTQFDPSALCRCLAPAQPFCVVDADCGSGQVCVCDAGTDGQRTNICVAAGCTQGSDCDSGECGYGYEECGAPRTQCRAPADGCHGDADCGGIIPSCGPSADGGSFVCGDENDCSEPGF